MASPEQIPELLATHEAVRSVRPTGSRERGEALPLSDWDFIVDVEDLDALKRALPDLVGSLGALGHQWDPLSDRWNYMIMLPGPVKVDLIIESPHQPEPPWEPAARTLPSIDHHFWDWILWLASKRSRGRTDLLREESQKMFEHLLAPMGASQPPGTIEQAIDTYLERRRAWVRSTGTPVDERMGDEVRRAISLA